MHAGRSARRVVIAGALAYTALLAVLYALQRSLLFPAPTPVPVPAGLGSLLEGRSPAGRRVVALWTEGRPGAPVAVYFHGNSMQLADSGAVAAVLRDDGWTVASVEYPGYGPLAEQSPSEEALVDVAEGALALFYARPGVRRESVVLVGQSLGTGVASALAARGHGGRVVLLAPFRSITAVARGVFPWLPVGLLVRDKFDTEARAPRVTVPVHIVHGDADAVVPYAHGVALSRLFPRATLTTLRDGHHNDLWSTHLDATLAALRAAR